MAFLLDRRNRLSYSAQIQRQALAQLVAGRLLPGDRLPSIRELARELHISRTTAERIQDLLCETMFAEIRPRSGAYVAAPDAIARSPDRKRAQELYEFLKRTIFEARRLTLDTGRLVQLIGAFQEGPHADARTIALPVLATRDAYDCLAACLNDEFPARLVHLPPSGRSSDFPRGARYLLSGYYLRGRAEHIAEAVGCSVLYIRYNVRLLNQSMTIPADSYRHFLTRDADNADSTRAFLASAYPEVSGTRYQVCSVDDWLSRQPAGRPDGDVWPTITAARKLDGHVDPDRVHVLHPLLADDFIDELRCLALLG